MLAPKETLRHSEDLGRHGPFALRGTGPLVTPGAPDEAPSRSYGVAAESEEGGTRFYVTAWTTSGGGRTAGRLRACAEADVRRRIDRAEYEPEGVYFVRLSG